MQDEVERSKKDSFSKLDAKKTTTSFYLDTVLKNAALMLKMQKKSRKTVSSVQRYQSTALKCRAMERKIVFSVKGP